MSTQRQPTYEESRAAAEAHHFGRRDVVKLLDGLSDGAVRALIGQPQQEVVDFASVPGWKVGDERPILADDDPAVMQAVGRCAAAHSQWDRHMLPIDNGHSLPCGWCDFDQEDRLAACSWAAWHDRYVTQHALIWHGTSGSTYARSLRTGYYQRPAADRFWNLPATERGQLIQSVIDESREGVAA